MGLSVEEKQKLDYYFYLDFERWSLLLLEESWSHWASEHICPRSYFCTCKQYWNCKEVLTFAITTFLEPMFRNKLGMDWLVILQKPTLEFFYWMHQVFSNTNLLKPFLAYFPTWKIAISSTSFNHFKPATAAEYYSTAAAGIKWLNDP